MTEKQDAICAAYRKLAVGGKLPTAPEVAKEAGVTTSNVYHTFKTMQMAYKPLPRYGRREKSVQPRMVRRKNTLPDGLIVNKRPKMTRILAVKMEGDPGKRPERLPGPGEGYAITDRVRMICPICCRPALIAPRMHPYWLRNRAGEVVFVCSGSCTGCIE